MGKDKRRAVLVGCGMVDMSCAYVTLNQQTYGELVLIDYVEEKAEEEAMGLNHGLAFSGLHTKTWSSTYADCKGAGIVTICTDVTQKPGESRVDLLAWDMAIFKSIVELITDSGFNDIFLTMINPVGIMTKVTCDLSGFNPKRIIGSGTSFGTTRLRYLVNSYFKMSPRSIHGYVMDGHDNSEFVLWSRVCIATKPMLDVIMESDSVYKKGELKETKVDVRTTANKIIATKKAAYYGISVALTRLAKTILDDGSSMQTASVYPRGEYKQNGVSAGVPVVINANDTQPAIRCQIIDKEQEKFNTSCKELKDKIAEAKRDLNH